MMVKGSVNYFAQDHAISSHESRIVAASLDIHGSHDAARLR